MIAFFDGASASFGFSTIPLTSNSFGLPSTGLPSSTP